MSTHSFRIINTTNDSQQIPVLRCLLNAETLLDLPVGNQAYEATDFLDDYRQIWTRVMRGFLATAGVGDYLVFAPEILPGALTTPANSAPKMVRFGKNPTASLKRWCTIRSPMPAFRQLRWSKLLPWRHSNEYGLLRRVSVPFKLNPL